MKDASRRDFLAATIAAPLAPLIGRSAVTDQQPLAARPTRIRTITAGVSVRALDDRAPVERALAFLEAGKRAFEDAHYEVQTLRVTLGGWVQPTGSADPRQPSLSDLLSQIRALDALVGPRNVRLNLGPVNGVAPADSLRDFITRVVDATSWVNCSVSIADAEHGIREDGIRAAAGAIGRIAANTRQGLGNFRFAAAANVPAGTPFFPVSRHEGEPAFAIGVESAHLVHEALAGGASGAMAPQRLKETLDRELSRIAATALKLSQGQRLRYLGIDASPAPGMDRSIGQAIESWTHVPFGRASTLAACALITDALKSLAVTTCGYSGLMLPVLEDPVLAARAREGTYGVEELLLYSSVCGTGLDVVPLAGDVREERLAALIRDVAALSVKWQKPLSARLLPVPGAALGDAVHFDDPLLTDCVAMRLE